jgi:hypothetical protein
MSKTTKRSRPNKELAGKIAAALFHNSFNGKQVQRLVQTDDNPPRVYGGWSQGPAADWIELVLDENLRPRNRRQP